MTDSELICALSKYLDGDFVLIDDFFKAYPQTDSLRKHLRKLKRLGYVTLDEGDGRILIIAITEKFKQLVNGGR